MVRWDRSTSKPRRCISSTGSSSTWACEEVRVDEGLCADVGEEGVRVELVLQVEDHMLPEVGQQCQPESSMGSSWLLKVIQSVVAARWRNERAVRARQNVLL